MSHDTTLSSITRSKLSLSSLSLHRWVLLKNSILSQPAPPHTPQPPRPPTPHPSVTVHIPFDDEPVAKATAVVVAAAAAAQVAAQAEAEAEAQTRGAFMFPDAGRFLDADDAQLREAQWLDELLESLGEEEEDEEEEEESSEEEDRPSLNILEEDYTPLVSPMSSLDDLSSSTQVPPHRYNYTFQQEDALPYYPDESEDYTMGSVPDAIEDTSDDEETSSEAPTTPSLGRSSTSFNLPPHPPPGGHPHPLSEEAHPHSRPTSTHTTPATSTMTRAPSPNHRHHHHHHPHVYSLDNPYFYSHFPHGQTMDERWPVSDPLPFPFTHHAYQPQC